MEAEGSEGKTVSKRRRRRSLVVFLVCVLVLIALVIWLRQVPPPKDLFRTVPPNATAVVFVGDIVSEGDALLENKGFQILARELHWQWAGKTLKASFARWLARNLATGDAVISVVRSDEAASDVENLDVVFAVGVGRLERLASAEFILESLSGGRKPQVQADGSAFVRSGSRFLSVAKGQGVIVIALSHDSGCAAAAIRRVKTGAEPILPTAFSGNGDEPLAGDLGQEGTPPLKHRAWISQPDEPDGLISVQWSSFRDKGFRLVASGAILPHGFDGFSTLSQMPFSSNSDVKQASAPVFVLAAGDFSTLFGSRYDAFPAESGMSWAWLAARPYDGIMGFPGPSVGLSLPYSSDRDFDEWWRCAYSNMRANAKGLHLKGRTVEGEAARLLRTRLRVRTKDEDCALIGRFANRFVVSSDNSAFRNMISDCLRPNTPAVEDTIARWRQQYPDAALALHASFPDFSKQIHNIVSFFGFIESNGIRIPENVQSHLKQMERISDAIEMLGETDVVLTPKGGKKATLEFSAAGL